MKKIALVFLLLISYTFVQSQNKVGTIDVTLILSKMPELNTVNDSIYAFGNKIDTQIQGKIDEYQKLIETYNSTESTLTQEQAQEKQVEIYTLENEITKLRQNAIQLLQLKDNELKRPLYEKIVVSMEKIAKADNYSQIFSIDMDSNLVYINPDFDITIAVLNDLGLPLD